MIGTEFIDGQGLGNQLFCYVTARAVAEENGYEFGRNALPLTSIATAECILWI